MQSNFTVGYPVRKTIPRAIMGEVPRARNTAQNTLTTWHADRLYGTILITALLSQKMSNFEDLIFRANQAVMRAYHQLKNTGVILSFLYFR